MGDVTLSKAVSTGIWNTNAGSSLRLDVDSLSAPLYSTWNTTLNNITWASTSITLSEILLQSFVRIVCELSLAINLLCILFILKYGYSGIFSICKCRQISRDGIFSKKPWIHTKLGACKPFEKPSLSVLLWAQIHQKGQPGQAYEIWVRQGSVVLLPVSRLRFSFLYETQFEAALFDRA